MHRFITAKDTHYRNGMNSLDDPKSLQDGECVELVNALPDYPLMLRNRYKLHQIYGSFVNDIYLSFGATINNKSYVFFVSSDRFLRYTEVPNDYSGYSDGFGVKWLDNNAEVQLSNGVSQLSGCTIGDIIYVRYRANNGIEMLAIEFVGSVCYARRIPSPRIIANGAEVVPVGIVDGYNTVPKTDFPNNNVPHESEYVYHYACTLIRRTDTGAVSTVYNPGVIETTVRYNDTMFFHGWSNDPDIVVIPLIVAFLDPSFISYTNISSYGFTHFRIYRTQNERAIYDATLSYANRLKLLFGATHYFLVDLPISFTDSWEDRTSDAALSGEMNLMAAQNYTMPPADGVEMLYYNNTMFLMGDKHAVYFSEIIGGDGGGNLAYAQIEKQKYALWFKPLEYRIDVDVGSGTVLTGMAGNEDALFIFKEKTTYMVVNATPLTSRLITISDNIGCINSHSVTNAIVDGQDVVFFMSQYSPMLIMQGGNVRPFSSFKVGNLWSEYIEHKNEKNTEFSAFYCQNTIFVVVNDKADNSYKMFCYRSFEDVNGAYQVTIPEIRNFTGVYCGNDTAVLFGYGSVLTFIVDILSNTKVDNNKADVVIKSSGETRYPIDVRLLSRRIYPGPQENSISELFKFTGYYEDYEKDDVSNPPNIGADYNLRIELISNRNKAEKTYGKGDIAFSNALVNSLSPDTLIDKAKSIVRLNADFVPKAGFIGEYFQYLIQTKVGGSSPFRWYGAELQAIPRPQLPSESIGGGLERKNSWE